MAVIKHNQFKITEAVILMLEAVLLVGLLYMAYNSIVIRDIHAILASGIIIMINLIIILFKRHVLLKKKEQEEIFQNIIHDLKAPLHNILGYVEISELKLQQLKEIEESNNIKNEISQNLDIISKEGIRLLHLSQEILNLSLLNETKGSIAKENFAVSELMSEAGNLLESLCNQKKLSYNVETNLKGSRISGDKEKLVQVIYNLISNAVKYTDSGYINCGSYENGSNVIFYIRDTGRGIPEENNKVFERFYTGDSDNKMKGYGIGLSICKEVVNMHGGKIWYKRNKDKGTTFYFSIPVR